MSASKPSQTQSGKVSKTELHKINKIIRAFSAMNQWCNTFLVIKWFQNLQKHKSKFLKFNIIDFYLSITEKLLKNAISFAKKW